MTQMTALHEDPSGLIVKTPDAERVNKAVKSQKMLSQLYRIHSNSSERLHQNFKRLEDDMKQVQNTLE